MLPDGRVDLVAAGQAFHWFEPTAARREFLRILRPGGWVALIWNDRRADADAFAQAYESLLRTYGTDYLQVHHQNVTPQALEAFFGGPVGAWTFPNEQRLDLNGVRGRLLSSSYAPAPGHPRHEAMMGELRRIFDEHHENGYVCFVYDARLFLGQLDPGADRA